VPAGRFAAANDGKLFVIEKFVVHGRLLFSSEGRIRFVYGRETKIRAGLAQ
jgi:hypothetical protein